ncbi:hypothetical protein Poli38472_013458 [Pythium oligandrum]|uniref:Crinkler effector protein N-terminal domain-containing protein n=1 Tax=Pythium oligandrum TaxID=41045 RepID=A0A8K1C7D4_PYTOL|nr:hypothetical protein Poli38472_013458 [Pythium oligandrum]|eukprot:TMW57984.1 hypothetical protein Poli38472_013458 [Pythium oligandrum]
MSSAAEAMELNCAVYGVGTIFSIKIAPDAKVSALQKAIYKDQRYKKRYSFPPSELTLYLARKGSVWLKGDACIPEILRGAVVDKEYKVMMPLLPLSAEQYFGAGFRPQSDDIHILVKLGSEGFFRQDRKVVVVDGVEVPITQDMDVNSTEIAAFWNALRACSTEIKPDAVIALPEGTYFLGEQKFGSRVYIRHCYPSLLKNCWELLHHVPSGAQVPSDVIILGNPGIGKTFFGGVILFHLARLGATVVYETAGTDKCYLFSSDTVITGLRRNFRHILRKQTTYYVVDAMKPEVNAAKTILLTSPRRSIWYEFNKANGTSRYMPVWSLDELMKCRDLVYPNIPVATVADCFRRWGGIARYVLRFAENSSQQAFLRQAINYVDLDKLVEACGKFEAKRG